MHYSARPHPGPLRPLAGPTQRSVLRPRGQVSILSPAINKGDLLGTLLGNIGKAAGMFFVEGDRIWRHNLSLRPMFEGPLALAFLVGVGVCIWHGIWKAKGNLPLPFCSYGSSYFQSPPS
ncbi:MAG: hypothetical protein HC853_15190 [Anaerolineae bacterium]|nr:hypothetical protein [Anaerolineae bacterium]